MKQIEPDVTVPMWVNTPDVAEYAMNSASQTAADYTTGWIVAGGIFATIITNFAIKSAGGPFGGIVDMVLKTFKKDDKKTSTS